MSAPTPLPPAVRFLLDRHQHADRPRQTRLVETHISWVVLTDRFAYKVKKPVRYSFLDFSTLDLRREACREELRLNRRLATDTYLDVVPIVERPNGQLAFGGLGTICEWAVKMRRLPELANLSSRLSPPASPPISSRELDQVARVLSDFYAAQPPLTLRPEQVRREWRTHLHDNEADLLAHLPGEAPRIQRIHATLLHYLDHQAQLFETRICDGRFVEGHGDLRPEHVYLQERPVILDCIEFSVEFRRLDIADELCFLWMECDHLGQSAVGERIWRACSQRLGDHPPTSLLDFYKAYRACVRAKVYALQAQQTCEEERLPLLEKATDYLRLADEYQARLGRGLVVVVMGLMGSGKSTLAEELASRLGAQTVQTDAVRLQMFGVSPHDAGFNADHYTPQRREAVYETVLDRAEALLATGATVILDGTFSQRAIRQRVREVATRTGADCVMVRCDCPRAVALERIQRRRRGGSSLSEAREELYDAQAQAWEPDELTGCERTEETAGLRRAVPSASASSTPPRRGSKFAESPSAGPAFPDSPAPDSLVVDTTRSLAEQRETVLQFLLARAVAAQRVHQEPPVTTSTLPW